jgi:hypothetical protein
MTANLDLLFTVWEALAAGLVATHDIESAVLSDVSLRWEIGD